MSELFADKHSMKKFMAYVKKQLSNRTDSEHRQAILRCAIVFIGLVYGVVVQTEWWPVAVSVFISCAIVAHIIYDPKPNATRRIIGCIQDNMFTTLFLYFGGPGAALYLFVYPFITVGNGFRFGVRYLAFSGALGAGCLGFLMYFGDAWSAEVMVGAGVLVSNVVVTIYTGVLLNRLNLVQEKITKMATHDSLTGLPNRSMFMEQLDRVIQNKESQSYGVCCIYFDLDGFKSVNDSLGHKAGDQLLVLVATKVRATLRSSDLVARLGGDEFTILLDTRTRVEDASKVAERVIQAIESINIIDGQPIKISASVGVAYMPVGNHEFHIPSAEVLKVADDQMYIAKRKGKGRVELAMVDHAAFPVLSAA